MQHHEWMNGSGYPQGLQGKYILLEARILDSCCGCSFYGIIQYNFLIFNVIYNFTRTHQPL